VCVGSGRGYLDQSISRFSGAETGNQSAKETEHRYLTHSRGPAVSARVQARVDNEIHIVAVGEGGVEVVYAGWTTGRMRTDRRSTASTITRAGPRGWRPTHWNVPQGKVAFLVVFAAPDDRPVASN